MSLLGPDGIPIGQVGKSVRPDGDRKGIDLEAVGRLYEMIEQRLRSDEGKAAIERRVSIHSRKVEAAISFWKPIYFSKVVDGRLLNGIEAYQLGDESRTAQSECDKAPYIAMCNLMALEAIRMMGDQMPTAEKAVLLAYASDREKEIAVFWKEIFSPTEFQAEWAWKAALSVLAGDPVATSEILDNYKLQLP